jgi:hypothetical protein
LGSDTAGISKNPYTDCSADADCEAETNAEDPQQVSALRDLWSIMFSIVAIDGPRALISEDNVCPSGKKSSGCCLVFLPCVNLGALGKPAVRILNTEEPQKHRGRGELAEKVFRLD